MTLPSPTRRKQYDVHEEEMREGLRLHEGGKQSGRVYMIEKLVLRLKKCRLNFAMVAEISNDVGGSECLGV